MLPVLAEGFVLGLTLGVSCLGTCLPVLLPYLFGEHRALKKNIGGVVLFLLGRLVGYIIFGTIAGAVGSQLPLTVRQPLTGAAYIILSGLLFFQAFRRINIEESCPAKRWQRLAANPLIFGLLLGLNPCPAFLLATSRAIEYGGPLAGAILFIGFFLGTSVFFLPVGFFGGLAKLKLFRWIARGLALLIGLWFAVNGIWAITQSIYGPKQIRFEVVDPLTEDTIYIAGDSTVAAEFKMQIDTILSAELIQTGLDSVPEKSLLVFFGENLDTISLLERGIGVVHSSADSTSVAATITTLKTYGFKRRHERGFYFKVSPKEH